jgi:hypothetical protein
LYCARLTSPPLREARLKGGAGPAADPASAGRAMARAAAIAARRFLMVHFL